MSEQVKKPVRFGGSFAPPLTAEKLAAYRTLAETAEPEAKDAMQKLLLMAETFQMTGESKLGGTPHPSGRGTVVPLEEAEKERIFDVVPWEKELRMYGQVFETISHETHPDLRNAAFHLLWYGKELCLDREPITNDKL